MRAKHKITGKTWAEHTKRNKSRKRARDEDANDEETEENAEIEAEVEMISDDEDWLIISLSVGKLLFHGVHGYFWKELFLTILL